MSFSPRDDREMVLIGMRAIDLRAHSKSKAQKAQSRQACTLQFSSR
jgi:hypothetical protein